MEIWRGVSGWEDSYQVSSEGRVRSLDRTVSCGGGHKRGVKGKLLKLTENIVNGYPFVTLSSATSKSYCVSVHLLVLSAFVGPAPSGMECCHNDGSRSNNRLENLRYDTRSNNALDRHVHGTMNALSGEEAGSAKLTWVKVEWIRANFGRLSMRAMGRKFGVHHRTISAVIKGHSWTSNFLGEKCN